MKHSDHKTINDPVYGFICIKNTLIIKLIDHAYFQRLRRIKQLGMVEYVYPSAVHTRFQHALGTVHLMGKALDYIISKGLSINAEEYEASQIAALLHDIGHGPFSHALERVFFPNMSHEQISIVIIEDLNNQLNDQLNLALRIYRNQYYRKFFYQLINGQLDVDRLDYLTRDCFYTGVGEGYIGTERILSMFNVINESLVIEQKGIHSIENSLHARRMMYWQVYLHKTAIGTEQMLINIIKRAQHLIKANVHIECAKPLKILLNMDKSQHDIVKKLIINHFTMLDDSDIWCAIKTWENHPDHIIATLCQWILRRNLLYTYINSQTISDKKKTDINKKIAQQYDINIEDAHYLWGHGTISNKAYVCDDGGIDMLTPTNEIKEITKISDYQNIKGLNKVVKKNYLCLPQEIRNTLSSKKKNMAQKMTIFAVANH